MDIPRHVMSLRRNSATGVIEDDNVKFHFSEWWNGEGLDFTFTRGKKELYFNLNMHEIAALVSACHALGMFDLDEVIENAETLLRQWNRTNKMMKENRKRYSLDDEDEDD